MSFRVAGGLHRLCSDRLSVTGALYLAPRVLPLVLVVGLSIRSGLTGLGTAALALSVWQFLLIASDWGVSQWLLTKREVSLQEVRTSIVGRVATSCLCALGLVLVWLWGWVSLSPTLGVTVVVGLALSFGQMAFAWELQSGNSRRAIAYAGMEFLVPGLLVFAFEDASVSVAVVVGTKTLIGWVLTWQTLRSRRWASVEHGLPPKSFGSHAAVLALTSFAAGTGELALLTAGTSAGVTGSYRLLQSVSALGSIIGMAAQAPLMGRAPSPERQPRPMRPMLLIGSASVGLLIAAYSLVLLSADLDSIGSAGWLAFVAATLGTAAVMNSISIVPLTYVAKHVGARYSMMVGVASAAAYWGLIIVLAATRQPLLAPIAVLASSCVGLVGNLVAARVFVKSRPAAS